jgi:hypothetical protein
VLTPLKRSGVVFSKILPLARPLPFFFAVQLSGVDDPEETEETCKSTWNAN